jgi:hypothetical protein
MGQSQRDYSAAHVRERGIALLEEATKQSRPRIVAGV